MNLTPTTPCPAEVYVEMPLQLSATMIAAVRRHPTTSCESMAEWHTRLGWLICAYDVLIEVQTAKA